MSSDGKQNIQSCNWLPAQIHRLRHTFSTWSVEEGFSIVYEVQMLLGHSSISVTQVYSHLAASELHGAVNKIQVVLN